MNKPFDSSGLTFRQDYFSDPVAWRALVSLLDDTFGIDIGPLQELGGPDPTSVPFGWFAADGTLAANLSALRFSQPADARPFRGSAETTSRGKASPAARSRQR